MLRFGQPSTELVPNSLADQCALDVAAHASAEEGIRQGLDDLRRGRTQAAKAVFDAFRSENRIAV